MSAITELDAEARRRAAAQLISAQATGEACAPVRELLGESLDAAYAVQELVIADRVHRGERRVGRKIGLTSVAVQQQLGVDQPDFGVLLASMDVSGPAPVSRRGLFAPRIEAELAFVLDADVEAPERDAVLAAVSAVVPALEIVDSRIRDWDIRIGDTIADNASSALYALGAERRRLDELVPADVVMTLEEDGVEVSHGNGAACLGDPLEALLWVARTADTLGRPLRAGEVVLSGALGPMVPFQPGREYRARISGLGEVVVTSEKEE